MPPSPRPPDAVDSISRHWMPDRPLRGTALEGDGFSGSPVWRIDALEGAGAVERSYVLKGFAAGWTRPRAEAIHALMRALRTAGVDPVPLPVALPSSGAGSVLEDRRGRFWELTEWRPGRPVDSPTEAQMVGALGLLARVHRAADQAGVRALFPGVSPEEAGPSGVPAWERRRQRLLRVATHGWQRPRSCPDSTLAMAIERRRARAAEALARHGGPPLLARLATLPVPAVPLQPVLRDVWRAHVLFDGSRVGGLIDLHAAGIDTPATDLARLLGSWRRGDAPDRSPTARGASGRISMAWREALDAYREIRPLTAAEARLADLLHVSGVVGGLDHWFQWVLDDGKEFRSPSTVEARVDFLLENLDSALQAVDSLLRTGG